MIKKIPLRYFFLVMIALIVVSVVNALAATNTVPVSRLVGWSTAIVANAIKPTACANINLSDIVICSGASNCNGTGFNDLILGSANSETIKGKGGSDCILGGGGNDTIIGNGGSDVCMGGPGNDTFTNCSTVIQ